MALPEGTADFAGDFDTERARGKQLLAGCANRLADGQGRRHDRGTRMTAQTGMAVIKIQRMAADGVRKCGFTGRRGEIASPARGLRPGSYILEPAQRDGRDRLERTRQCDSEHIDKSV